MSLVNASTVDTREHLSQPDPDQKFFTLHLWQLAFIRGFAIGNKSAISTLQNEQLQISTCNCLITTRRNLSVVCNHHGKGWKKEQAWYAYGLFQCSTSVSLTFFIIYCSYSYSSFYSCETDYNAGSLCFIYFFFPLSSPAPFSSLCAFYLCLLSSCLSVLLLHSPCFLRALVWFRGSVLTTLVQLAGERLILLWGQFHGKVHPTWA